VKTLFHTKCFHNGFFRGIIGYCCKFGEQFQQQYVELNNLQEEDFNYFIHRCYFMSLSQLFEVIKRSSDNDSFDENLPNNIIETGAFDWYYEYGILNK
jgi:hypothetical protein